MRWSRIMRKSNIERHREIRLRERDKGERVHMCVGRS